LNLLPVVPLFAIIALGALCGHLRLFPNPRAAIEVLNRFALYVAFPLLVISSLSNTEVPMAGGAGFFVAMALAAAAQLAIVVVAGRVAGPLRAKKGPLALGAIFGNFAYLGMPFCISVLGEEATGLAALAVAFHILLAMCLGPVLLLQGSEQRWSGREIFKKVAIQPLVWAPFIGLVLRLAPSEVLAPFAMVAEPVGAAAGPVALFLIGLYLHVNRAELRRPDLPLVALSSLKLVVYPAVAWLSVLVVGPWLGLGHTEAAVVVLMAAMPIAVTTFALAEEFETGRALLARGIVATTVLSLVTLPLLASYGLGG
jgi:predicted permease